MLARAATAGSNSATSTCKVNTCDVTVKATGEVKSKILGARWELEQLLDDSIEVEVNGQEKVVREGETATLAGVKVQVKDADAGRAKLVISK